MVFRFGDFALDDATLDLSRAGESLELDRLPLRLVVHLVRHRDRVVSKQELLDQVWDGAAVGDAAIASALKAVRRVLGDDGKQQRWIRTHRRRGFRFIGDVRIETSPSGSNGFVGRAETLTALMRGLAEARDGRASLYLLEGEPGVGKTRIAQEIGGRARAEGIASVFAACDQGLSAPAFWPWSAALRALGSTFDPFGAAARVTTRGSSSKILSPAAFDTDFEIADAIAGELIEASKVAPLLVTLDDVQWGDPGSLRVLELVLQRGANCHLLLVATRRSEEAGEGSAAAAGLARVTARSNSRVIPIEGLDKSEVAQLLERELETPPSERVVDGVLERSRGNPLFILELATQLRQHKAEALDELQPDRGLRGFLRERLRRLPAPAQRVLEALAVLDQGSPLSIVARFVGSDPNGLVEQVAAAVRGGLVELVSGSLRFPHELVREVVYASIDADDLRLAHLRALQVLGDFLPAEDRRREGALALHAVRALPQGDPEHAYRLAVAGAERARDYGSFVESARLFELALEALDHAPFAKDEERVAAMVDQSTMVYKAGELDRSRSIAWEAASLAERIGYAEGLVWAAIQLSSWTEIGRPLPRLIELLERARTRCSGVDLNAQAELISHLAKTRYAAGDDASSCLALCKQALEIARKADDPSATASVLDMLLRVDLGNPDLTTRGLALEELASHARRDGHSERARILAFWTAIDSFERGDGERVDKAIASSQEPSPTPAGRFYVWHAGLHENTRAIMRGRLVEAETRALALFQEWNGADDGSALQAYAAQRMLIQLLRGNLSGHAREIAAMRERSPLNPLYRLTDALARMERERRDEASVLYREGLEASAKSQRGWFYVAELAILADLAVELGSDEDCAVLHARLLPYADRTVIVGLAVNCLGSVATRLARLAARLGQSDEARHWFENALLLETRLGADALLIGTQRHYAAWLRTQGEREPAEALSSRANASARDLGLADPG